MSSLPSSATWEHPQCLDIMFVTSKRREGELWAVITVIEFYLCNKVYDIQTSLELRLRISFMKFLDISR